MTTYQPSLVLDLSTAHMPESLPSFGDLRYCGTEYGFVVFLGAFDDPEDWSGVPPWLWPIVSAAKALGCGMLNFDRDAESVDFLPRYEWP